MILLDAASEALLVLFAENIKLRSPELFAHARRISRTARAISDLLPVEATQVELTATAALLFPIVYSPSDIPELLTGLPVLDSDLARRSNELEEALQVLSGLQQLEEFNEMGNIIKFANEHFDGKGFPNRLAAESIPLASRIVSAARGYDLLTRVALDEFMLSHENAIDHMLHSNGSGVYDPAIVEILDRVEPNNENSEIVFVPDPLPGARSFQTWVTAD